MPVRALAARGDKSREARQMQIIDISRKSRRNLPAGIPFPAARAVAVAQPTGRPSPQEHACCSIKIGGRPAAVLRSPCAA